MLFSLSVSATIMEMNVFSDLELLEFLNNKIIVDRQKISLVFIDDDKMANSVLSNNLNAYAFFF